MASLVNCVARRTPSTLTSLRTISSSCIIRKDLVKDFYLREIKSYKPAPLAKDAHVGAVKNFSTPSSPTPPTLPKDLVKEMEAYDKAEPGASDLASQTTPGQTGAPPSSSAKEFLDFLEADHPKADAHH